MASLSGERRTPLLEGDDYARHGCHAERQHPGGGAQSPYVEKCPPASEMNPAVERSAHDDLHTAYCRKENYRKALLQQHDNLQVCSTGNPGCGIKATHLYALQTFVTWRCWRCGNNACRVSRGRPLCRRELPCRRCVSIRPAGIACRPASLGFRHRACNRLFELRPVLLADVVLLHRTCSLCGRSLLRQLPYPARGI